MEDSGAILSHISALKDMLDQVDEEIRANYQITREIESEIVKCTEIESVLAARESELIKALYLLQFEINGFLSVTADSRRSVKLLEEDLSCLRMKRDEVIRRLNDNREEFTKLCLEFQRNIDKGENGELMTLLSDKEFLENEIHHLDKKNSTLKNSMLAFMEEVLEELRDSNSALQFEIQSGCWENEKLLKDINDLKGVLISTSVIDNDKCVAPSH